MSGRIGRSRWDNSLRLRAASSEGRDSIPDKGPCGGPFGLRLWVCRRQPAERHRPDGAAVLPQPFGHDDCDSFWKQHPAIQKPLIFAAAVPLAVACVGGVRSGSDWPGDQRGGGARPSAASAPGSGGAAARPGRRGQRPGAEGFEEPARRRSRGPPPGPPLRVRRAGPPGRSAVARRCGRWRRGRAVARPGRVAAVLEPLRLRAQANDPSVGHHALDPAPGGEDLDVAVASACTPWPSGR